MEYHVKMRKIWRIQHKSSITVFLDFQWSHVVEVRTAHGLLLIAIS